MLRKLRHALEGALILFALLFFRLLPLDAASWLGGRLARLAGPFARAHRTARANLQQAFPEWDEARLSQTLRDMWDNLGRVVGEYPHLSRAVMRRRITVSGAEHLALIRGSGKAAIFVSGHFANWEVIPLAASLQGLPMTVIYREANNPVAEWLIRKIRAPYVRAMHGKGRTGAMESIRALKEGRPLALLVDQKQNDGAPVPFFGRNAMTTTAPAQLAVRFQAPLIPAHARRTKGARFHITVLPPVPCAPDAEPIRVMADLHLQFERWIRDTPAQWFWVHKRWG